MSAEQKPQQFWPCFDCPIGQQHRTYIREAADPITSFVYAVCPDVEHKVVRANCYSKPCQDKQTKK